MLLYISFLFFIAALWAKRRAPLTEVVSEGMLYFAVFTVAFTETLSIFKSVNFIAVLSGWLIFLGLCCLYLYRNRAVAITSLQSLINFKNIPLWQKLAGGLFFVMAMLLLFQALAYPPNNWDSMSYHMTRIAYWLGNGSVAHFPTHMLRNLYQPPLGEYLIMHAGLLNGNDYLANTLQLLFLLLCCCQVWNVARAIGLGVFYRWLALILILSIPSAELQATTPKNDIICAFFVISALYYCIMSYRSPGVVTFIQLGLSVGLGMFTKGTFYLYIAPVLLVFGIAILYLAIRQRRFYIVYLSAMAGILAIAINTPAYYRNYCIDQNILNIDKAEASAYSNEKMSGTLLLSSLLKNAGLHMGYPFAVRSDGFIRGWHKKQGINIDDPANNYYGQPFVSPIETVTNEDGVPNTIHFMLMNLAFIAVVIGLTRKKNYTLALLTVIILLQALLFAFFLKWQPWHSRLHIPLFILAALLIAATAQKIKIYRFLAVCAVPLVLYSFYFLLVYNNLRPLKQNLNYTARTSVGAPRFSKYFAVRPELFSEYSQIEKIVDRDSIRTIGTMITDWEYPLFHNCFADAKHIYAINVMNNTARIPQQILPPDIIISNVVNNKIITFAGKDYYNQSPGNKSIWIYK